MKTIPRIRTGLAAAMMTGALAAGLLVWPHASDAQSGGRSLETKLTASDAAAGDLFGESVAIAGDTIVVGAQHNNDAGPVSGSAHVFLRNGTAWTEQAKLTASDAAAGDQFGGSVAIAGDTIVVGARFDDDAGFDSGAAYVFLRNGTAWTEQAKLTASDAAAGDQFGNAVAIAGETIVVGANGNDDAGPNSGSAYAYQIVEFCDGRLVTYLGTEDDDVIEGTADRDVIHGLAGNDVIRGLGGHDVICGGGGDEIHATAETTGSSAAQVTITLMAAGAATSSRARTATTGWRAAGATAPPT